MRISSPLAVASLALFLLACQTPAAGTASGSAAVLPTPAASDTAPSIESREILEREQQTDLARVKHILISWAELRPMLGGQQDPRAHERSQGEAAAIVSELLARIQRDGEDIDGLMAEYSEDPGSASTALAYTVERDSALAFMFRRLSLRLQPGETGVVKTQFGYHLIQREE